MKIAYVYLSKLTGKDANINQMLNMLAALGERADVTLISSWLSRSAYRETLAFFAIKERFSLVRLPISLVTRHFSVELLCRLLYCAMALLYVSVRRYDVIYTRDVSFLVLLSYLPRFLRPRQRIVYEAHTIYHLSSPDKVSFSLEARAVALADTLVPISQGIYDDLQALFKVPAERMAVMEDGVNLKNFAPTPGPAGAGDRTSIIYSGSFIDWKGVEVLVEAVKYLSKPAVEILIVGGVDPDLARIRQLAKAEGVESQVIIAGRWPQQELIPRMLSSGIGVLPNVKTAIGEKYTSPLKLFEYMACGMAIVSADLPAMREVLEEEENALFFEPSNARDLAQQLDRLLDNRDLRESLQKTNQARAGYYSWDTRAERILALLENTAA